MPHTAERQLNDGSAVKEYGLMSYHRIIGVDSDNEEFLDKLRSSMRNFYSSSVIARKSFIEDVLKNTFTKLYSMSREDASNNRDSISVPGYAVVKYAKDWITDLCIEIGKMNLEWIEPHVTTNSDGEIVFEWWYGRKKLTIYVGDQSAEYVQVWGRSVDSLITDGDAETINVCRSLWIWLVS